MSHGPELLAGLIFRRPAEADHPRLARLADDWFERRERARLPRDWLRAFGDTSWLAERPDGRPAGLLIGFWSPGHPSEGLLLLVMVDPAGRHRGLDRALVNLFTADARDRGLEHVRAVAWPGDPLAVRFLAGLGFVALELPGSRRLYGTPAVQDYDGEGEDRAIFELDLVSSGSSEEG